MYLVPSSHLWGVECFHPENGGKNDSSLCMYAAMDIYNIDFL